MSKLSSNKIFITILFTLFLISCGGSENKDGNNNNNVTPSNVTPTANAGSDRTVAEKTTVTLSGSGTDTDGSIVSYQWLQIAGINVNLNNSNLAIATFDTPDVDLETQLTFELTTTDNDGSSSKDSVVITIISKDPELSNGSELTNKYNYQIIGQTDSQGSLDLTGWLKENNYINSSDQDNYSLFITSDMQTELSNIQVEYLLEKNGNLLHLRIEDPTGSFATVYQTENVTELLQMSQQRNANKSTQQAVPILRLLLQVILRTIRLAERVDAVITVHDFFNLDISFKQYNDEIYFEGTIGEFYTAYSGFKSILRLPLTMGRFVNRLSSKVRVSRAFSPKSGAKNEILDYVKNVAGYYLANNDTKIRVKLNNVNNRGRFFSIMLLDQQSADSGMSDLYDITLNIQGISDYNFDFLSDPDFHGWIIIKGAAFNFSMPANELSAKAKILKIPLQIGDVITVSILDQDLIFDDEVYEFQFTYSGNNYSSSNELATVSLQFDKRLVIAEPLSSKLYEVAVTITGDSAYNFDVFGNAPDFRGSIIFNDYTVEMEVTDNSYTATYYYQNISLTIGDDIYIYLEDEDVFSDDKVLETSFIFDGSQHIEDGAHITVIFNFAAQ